jgi:glycosyltransferase involved in cell wall biosynthesis
VSAAPRALFVCDTLSGGGAERFVSTALVHLDRARIRPELCLFRNDITYPLPDDVPLTVIEKQRPWQIPGAIVSLARHIERTAPDAVFSAFSHPNFIVGNALAMCRVRPRWVARVSNDPDRNETGLLRVWMRNLYARADAVLANSPALCRAFVGHYAGSAGKAAHLENAVDFARIDEAASESVAAGGIGAPLLVAVGRLHPQKRVDRMIEVVARLRERHDAHLLICGEGPQRRELERDVARRGLAERVHFEGFHANPYAWMARADLFLLTSDYEGSPNALIEAQGLGVPAVAVDCRYGPDEVIDDGETGLLVSPGDDAALAEAVATLLSDGELRAAMGRAAKARVRRRHDVAAVVRRLEAHLLGDASESEGVSESGGAT